MEEKKIQMGIREGVARAVNMFVKFNMRDFMYITKVAEEMGYKIDTTKNQLVFTFGLLVAQTFYAYQVYPPEKAELISELTEYFLGTFEEDDKYIYDINGAYLDISEFDILLIYKAYEKIYLEAETDYLKNGQVLPPLKVAFSVVSSILGYRGEKEKLSDYRTICNLCVDQFVKHLDFWKMLESKIDYIWSE